MCKTGMVFYGYKAITSFQSSAIPRETIFVSYIAIRTNISNVLLSNTLVIPGPASSSTKGILLL